jgi:hypothetical protein
MKTRGFWHLGDVSDELLLSGLRELLTAEGRSEARIVAHLAEVDERRLHLKQAAPSLFDYWQKKLGLSDNQAYYRIAAARVARRFPIVFELLERREIHLTNIAPLGKHLTAENHLELLGEAGRLSKRELLRCLAQRYPRPEVPSRIRKLPERELVPQAGAVSAGPTGSLEPRSETHYRLQLNTPERVKAKLELARDLMSHANPSGDLVIVVERGLDLLIDQLQKKRFGVTSRPRRRNKSRNAATVPSDRTAATQPSTKGPQSSTAEPATSSRPAKPVQSEEDFDRSKSNGGNVSQSPSRHRSARAHIPHETLRQVVERDGLCCSYVGDDGVRCTARAFLQVDHRDPWVSGGPDAFDNLRIFCFAHNRLTAEQYFGKEHVANAIEERRRA